MKKTCSKNEFEQLSFQSFSTVQQICQPFFDFLNVQSFHFSRYYAAFNKSIYLFTTPEWARYYIDNYSTNVSFLKKKEQIYKENSKYNIDFLLWKDHFSHLPHFQVARDGFNIDNGIKITRRFPEFTETFHLATSAENKIINQKYLSNIDPILKFLDYFVIQAQTLISPFLTLMLKNSDIKSSEAEAHPLSNTVNDLYKCFNIEHLPLTKPDGTIIHLSKRETDCLKGIAQGLNAKNIAKSYSISHRTVEQYLEQLRLKLDAPTCTFMLTQLYKDPVIRNFLLSKF